MKPIDETPCTERNWLIIIVLLGGVALFFGWRVFWFLTDDAYIAFRYISNAHLGYGYVWNPPPFLPVEGYTSFLWIVLLDIVWRILDIKPPVSANWIGLVFSYLTLIVGITMIIKIKWHARLKKHRLLFVMLFVVFLCFNRTFLAWSSSGLETAMMDFFLVLWVCVILFNSSTFLRVFLGALTAAFLALTRPDGLLFSAATIIIVFLLAFTELDKGCRRKILSYGLLPFGIVLMHQAWRLSFYGEWLPNTYYAKVTGSWPHSGLFYIMSFMLEYNLWFAVILISWALINVVTDNIRKLYEYSMPGHRLFILMNSERGVILYFVVVGTLIFHIGYYCYIVGGDHFEYRVYTYILPLIFVAFIWSLNRLCMHRFRSISVMVTFILLSMPVQWTHWMLTKNLNTREQTHVMRVPIAPSWPWMVRWYADAFDRMQSWLIYHHVCMRHQEHKVFWLSQVNRYMSREQGMQISREQYPIYAESTVGVPAWVMPHVSIIDAFGLNDYIIARTAIDGTTERLMAHSRHPPAGYIESFRPNVVIHERQAIFGERAEPITREYIIANERYWRDKLKFIESKSRGVRSQHLTKDN